MTDVHTKAQRSLNMSRIRGRDTKPEMHVRRLLHRHGYRYVLHRKDLPGRPDIVFPARRKVIFVHGCYWHRHTCRFGQVKASSNAEFWEQKISGNVSRDERQREALAKAGWSILTIWECEAKDAALLHRLSSFLDSPEGRSGD